MKPRDIKKLTATLKAISDPTRRAIFDLVWNSEKQESISTVTKEFKITRQGITKHLKILRDGGLIELKRIGRVTYCNADISTLPRVNNWLNVYQNSEKAEPSPRQTEEVTISKSAVSVHEALEKNKSESPLRGSSKPSKLADSQPTKLLVKTDKMAPVVSSLEETLTQKIMKAELEKAELLQMSIDPNDPGTPVKLEPVKEEPVNKETKEKSIEVTENQLDIYGVRKEPKLNEEQQFELF